MNLIEAFLRNPVKVSVGVVMVAMFGIIALLRMPMQLTPEVTTPTLTIETLWPGASPQEMEREIIQEQEEQLKAVEGVTKMSSECMDSAGRITLEFLVGTDMSEALLKVNTRLQQVREYPEDADEPVISTSNSNDRPIAWFILSQRSPTADEIRTFQSEHPETTDRLAPALRGGNPGLVMLHLRLAAKAFPVVNQLLGDDIDVTTLRKFTEDVIESRFERVEGVSNANVFGGREEELQVVVNPQNLAARSLTVHDVRQALRAHNQDTSGGDFWEGKRRYVVRTLGQFRSPEQVENVIVARRDGAPVYVRDVAKVTLGYKKPDGLVRRFGGSSIAVNAQRETGSNVFDVMNGLREACADLNENLLRHRGLSLIQVYDETEYIDSAIDLAQNDIYLGGALTVAALLLFLRSMRSTLVIGLAIPTTLLGSFIALKLMGRTFNVLSLAGLAFAVGMFVDNFIVVLENIFRHYQLGEDRIQASVKGTKEVWGAVVAATIGNLGVFAPVLLIQGEAGQLFRDIALAVSAGLALSLLVAVAMIPTATSRILEHEHGGGAAGPDWFARSHSSRDAQDSMSDSSGWDRFGNPLRLAWRRTRPLRNRARSVLDAFGLGFVDRVLRMNRWAQRSAARSIAVILFMVGASVLGSWLLLPGVEYLPAGNRNLVFGILLPPPGYNLDQLMEMGETIETRMRPYWDVDPGDPKVHDLKYPAIGDFFYVARGRQVFVGLRAVDPLRAGGLVNLIREVAADMEGTFAIAKQSSLFEQGLSEGRTIDIEVTGPELTQLIDLGGGILRKVPKIIPGAQVIPKPSLDLSSPEVHVVPKWEQAADMQVTAADLGYTVDALVDGAYAADYFIGGDKIDLSIIGQEQFARRTQDLESLTISTPTGDLVPLSAVAGVRLSSGPEQINHRERQRAITIQVSPPLEMALEDAMDRIDRTIVQPLLAGNRLDGGYHVMLSGTADKLRSTWRDLRYNFLLALVLTYLLMAALFESWLYPFVIILSVPLGMVGGFAGLFLLNRVVLQPLDVLTMLGFVILIGTVVNNPILIIHQTLNHMRDDGMPQRAAILESVRTRIRPIFMTTITTVLGLMPLVLFPGAGSELYRGLGAVVLGGLVVSTIFTLVLVPCLFSFTMDVRTAIVAWLHRKTGSGKPRAPQPVPREPAMVP